MSKEKICPFISRVVIGEVFEDTPEPGLGGHYNKGTVFLSQICLKEQCAAWGNIYAWDIDGTKRVPAIGCNMIYRGP